MRMVVLMIFALWDTPVAAQQVNCMTTTVQSAMNECAYTEWQAADAQLNEAYGAAMAFVKTIDADLPPGEQGAAVALRAGQRAWITFRDESCAAEGYLMHGGSAQPLLIYGCQTRLTHERIQGLLMIGPLDE